jgi:hypothetical protein
VTATFPAALKSPRFSRMKIGHLPQPPVQQSESEPQSVVGPSSTARPLATAAILANLVDRADFGAGSLKHFFDAQGDQGAQTIQRLLQAQFPDHGLEPSTWPRTVNVQAPVPQARAALETFELRLADDAVVLSAMGRGVGVQVSEPVTAESLGEALAQAWSEFQDLHHPPLERTLDKMMEDPQQNVVRDRLERMFPGADPRPAVRGNGYGWEDPQGRLIHFHAASARLSLFRSDGVQAFVDFPKRGQVSPDAVLEGLEAAHLQFERLTARPPLIPLGE